MKKIILSGKRTKIKTKSEFAGFVADQFRKLTKKNLKIPVQLYHL